MAEAKRTLHQSRGKPIQYILSSPEGKESPQERQTKVRVKEVKVDSGKNHLHVGDVEAKGTDWHSAPKEEVVKALTLMYCRWRGTPLRTMWYFAWDTAQNLGPELHL